MDRLIRCTMAAVKDDDGNPIELTFVDVETGGVIFGWFPEDLSKLRGGETNAVITRVPA